MPGEIPKATVPETLPFHPEWFTDPPWILLRVLEQVDPRQLVQVARTQLEGQKAVLTARKMALKAELEAIDAHARFSDALSQVMGAKL